MNHVRNAAAANAYDRKYHFKSIKKSKWNKREANKLLTKLGFDFSF